VSDTEPGSARAKEIPGSITTVHRYDLPLPREEAWSLISDVSNYGNWWPWLRVFDAAALAPGEEWRCEVQPPVPYLVRFRVVIEEVETAVRVQARVLGDVVGAATLRLEDTPSGCAATLDSTLAPGNTYLRMVSRFAGPIARFGHDWVLDTGARQFIARAVEPLVGD
jgi:uncharacterized protein YndB with AHSA1/START domain